MTNWVPADCTCCGTKGAAKVIAGALNTQGLFSGNAKKRITTRCDSCRMTCRNSKEMGCKLPVRAVN